VIGVESRNFSDVLQAARIGDPDAVEAILSRYMPLINSRSIIDGVLDEDMRQYIAMRVIMQISRFDPNPNRNK
jgi:DNA-directed RNA polymerase specialized sigma subunit